MTLYQGTIPPGPGGCRFCGIHCVFFIFLMMLLATNVAYATPILSPVCGSGSNNIPDAVDDGLGGVTPGILSCGITTNLSGIVGSGNTLTISLIGFHHEASGDIGITLTHFTDATRTVILGAQQTMLYRIGKVSIDPNDFGYAAQFGDPLGFGENYDFNSANTTNIWTVATSLGAADFIPGQVAGFNTGYGTNGPLSSVPNVFSSMFAGQLIAGFWQLDVTDYAAGPSAIPVTGTLLQWQLDIANTTIIPEPGYGAVVLAMLMGFATLRRRDQIQ